MQLPNYSTSKAVQAGALGGFVGSVVLGVLAAGAAIGMGQEMFYVTIAKKLGLGDASVIAGWTLHFIVGLVAGAVFVGATAIVKKLALTSTRKALWLGLVAGALIWIVVYVPVTLVLVPADLASMTMTVGSLILHMLFGIVTALIAVTMFRKSLKTVTQHV